MNLAVRPEYGPTLPELLRGRLSRRAARAVAVGAALAALAIAAALILGGDGDEHVVAEVAGVKFNFVHGPKLVAVDPRPGEVLRLESSSRGRFVQAFSVLPLELPPYAGAAGGALPVLANAEIAALRADRAEFELVQEGKARINETAGYSIVYRARLGERRLYGRLVLLPEPQPGARRGVKLLLEATPAAGVPRALDVGARGLTKRPFRSFRFGTERP